MQSLNRSISLSEKESKVKMNAFAIIMSSFLFLLFLYMSISVPLTGDDWTNALLSPNNFFELIEIVFSKYFTHEGRLVSRFFVILFTNAKWLWNIFNAFMIASIFVLICSIARIKGSILMTIVIALSMLLIENTMFTQGYLWVTGNITYTLPLFFVLIYFYLIFKSQFRSFKQSTPDIIFSFILNLSASMMIENISASLVAANFFILVYIFYKHKKINKNIFMYFLVSLTGFLIMYLSPGARQRLLNQNSSFSNLNIVEKVLTNIPNFIDYTFLRNEILILLLSIVMFGLIIKNTKGVTSWFYSFFASVIPLATILSRRSLLSSDNHLISEKIYVNTKWLLDSSNYFVIGYWSLFSVLLIFIILKYTNSITRTNALFFIITGVTSNLAMLLSPIWGGRTAMFTVFMLYIACFILMKDLISIKLEKYIAVVLIPILIFISITLLILYRSVYLQQQDRERDIKQQLETNADVIHFDRSPDYVLWNANAWNEFHEKKFKQYYGIPENAKLSRDVLIYEDKYFYKRD